MKALEIREGQCPAGYLHGVVTLAEGVDLKALGAYGVRVNTVVGNMATVQIPGKKLSDLIASGLCAYIDLGHPVMSLLDKARADLGVDYIHQGVNLPQSYDGSGDTLVLSDQRYTYAASGVECIPLAPCGGQTVRLGFHHHNHGGYGIVTLTNVKIDYLQGIGEVAPERWKVETSGLSLTVTGEEDAQLNVYDVMGRCVVSSPKANGTFLLPAAGVYVVQVNGRLARKIAVH